MAELEFHGAAETVTGSLHVLHTDDGAIYLDCGLFQGRREDSRRINQSFPTRPADVKCVLLSHAHIDHSGRLPRLYRDGFTGPSYATRATCSLLSVMLADSAHIQEEDARFWNEKRAEGPQDFIQPLYTHEDVLKAMEHFLGVPYNQPLPVAGGVTATFLEAGHVLGSSSVLVELDGWRKTRLLYTGDLGRFDMPILRDPHTPLPEVDYLITESTYANRRHNDEAEMADKLVAIIQETRAAGGKVVIPAFSLGRTQHLVYALSQAIAAGKLEPLPIYVDSPLSVNITQVFREHPECYDAEARDFWHSQGGVFGRDMIRYITRVDDSKALNDMHEPMVIIASSGMCEFGRILHHLKNTVEDEKNTVVMVGFQAQHTLGRRIVERAEQIKIFGRMYELLARVEVLNGFSAHADMDDFAKLLAPLAPRLKAAFVVHGEPHQVSAMRDTLVAAGCSAVHIPTKGDRFKL
ncbi:MAG: MBL fold metallo-hydrolase [Planctomycetes bacterium]|nr:MBL fold metallo-hydrolase [Planctomycetota bacterium]